VAIASGVASRLSIPEPNLQDPGMSAAGVHESR
jgi:hypothetical protein